MSEKTIFQKIIDREIPAELLHEDAFCVAFRDIQPQAPVHVLIVPKKLIPRGGEAVADDGETLGALLLILPSAFGVHSLMGWSPMLLGLIACAASLPLLVAGAVLRRRYLKGQLARD
jgi:hypothetical protein